MVHVRQWSSQWFSYLGDFVVMVCGNFLRISSVCELGDFVLRERERERDRERRRRRRRRRRRTTTTTTITEEREKEKK